MSIFRRKAPAIACISLPLVKAFAFMVQHPGMWVTPADMVERGLMSRATAYRRFDDLVGNKALQAKRMGDVRHYKLHPKWADSALGRKLHARAVQRGLVSAELPES